MSDVIRTAEKLSKEILAEWADEVDRDGRWPEESLAALGGAGLLGLTVPPELGGLGAPPSGVAGVVGALAEGCASTAMIFMMHVCAQQVIVSAADFPERETILREMVAGKH